jgi:DNA-binding CsgD family transcriptional regulator
MDNSMIASGEKTIWQGKIVTKREIECAHRLIDGLTAKETARLMNISHRTVEKYIENLKYKLQCRNLKQLITVAITNIHLCQMNRQL